MATIFFLTHKFCNVGTIELYLVGEINNMDLDRKVLISINYYFYLIIIVPITLFMNIKRASYSDYFELCRSPNRKYM